jgi:hypothetical protein
MRLMLRALLLFPLAGCLTSLSTGLDTALFGEGRRVLFIGNSLTYVNDLPGMLKALADSAGGDRIAVAMVAFPDFNLEDHRAQGVAQREIAKGGWELVVLQQGPSSVEENRAQLRLSTDSFAVRMRAVNARPALYSVWPTSSRRQDFTRAIESYTLAAADVNGLLIPVAAAWLAAWRRDSTLALYDLDGLHPAPMGTYLAALVFYARITGRTPVGLPARLGWRGGTMQLTAPTALTLQRAAAEVTGF